MILSEIEWRRLFRRSYIRAVGSGVVSLAPSVVVSRSRIIVYPGARLIVEAGARISDTEIYVSHGSFVIGRDTMVCGTQQTRLIINIEDGDVYVGKRSRISCRRIWVRFGGKLSIGEHTNINAGSEIRCDEKVEIGSYNQISYDVRIWDTNTHNILPIDSRRRLTDEAFPYFGKETKRPVTSPVYIGSDCWIGERAAILKGSNLNDECIVAFGAVLTGQVVPPRTTAVTNYTLRLIQH